MKKCFTINQTRKKEEIQSYGKLIDEGLYQAIEIFYPYKESDSHINDYIMSIKEIQSRNPNLEIVLHLPHAKYNGISKIEHINAGSVEIMLAAIQFGNIFNAKKLTLHLGQVEDINNRQSSIKNAIASVKTIALFAKKYNQVVMIENMPSSNELGYSPSEILEIIKAVDENNVKFIFDTGHCNASCYKMEEYFEVLKDYLYHIHYSDNDSTTDQHRRMGFGNIDFNKHFSILKSIDYKELHCMEVIYHTADDLREYVNDFKKYE